MNRPEQLILQARDLHIEARGPTGPRAIVSKLSLTLRSGETIGIVGESGSGKTMTARALIGLLPPGVSATGEVVIGNRNLLGLRESVLRTIRGRQIALLLQDPFTMLNPLMRVGRQITESLPKEAWAHGSRNSEAIRRLAEVGITDASVADRLPYQLSGGMRQRVAIAAALASDPEILVADEPSTALDVTTQKEILGLLRAIQKERGMGLILITHDLRVAFALCDRIFVLYAGALLESGPSSDVEADPVHPYTLALLMSEPTVEGELTALASIPGSVPIPAEVADVCPFVPRCAFAGAECSQGSPPLQEVEPTRMSACVRIEAIRDDMRQVRRQAPRRSMRRRADATPETLLSVVDLHKRFGSFEAVRGVSLSIGLGESVGIVGESGSGKTTIARCLVGLEEPSAGNISIANIDASSYRHATTQQRRALRGLVQIIFQDPYSSLNPLMTVGAALKEAIAAGSKVQSTRRTDVPQLLDRVGLPTNYANRRPVALSGGERQRVAIARALALQPRLIICDEPVSALDVSVQAQILNLFRELRSELEVAYLFITHDLAVVRQVADRLYVLQAGSVVEEGSVETVLSSPATPYTRRLVQSVPRSDHAWLDSRAGDVSTPIPT